MGGAVAGIAGQIAGQIASQLIGSVVGGLLEKFGAGDVAGAATNTFMDGVGEGLKGAIGATPFMPEFIKGPVMDAVDGAIAGGKEEAGISTTEEAQSAVDDVMAENLFQGGQDAVEEAGKKADGSGAKGGNWLVAMMRALSAVAGQHLKKSIEASDKIGDLEGAGGSKEDQAAQMTELQGEMQAETQMFKLVQEAATTVVKSVGEALSSTARKAVVYNPVFSTGATLSLHQEIAEGSPQGGPFSCRSSCPSACSVPWAVSSSPQAAPGWHRHSTRERHRMVAFIP